MADNFWCHASKKLLLHESILAIGFVICKSDSTVYVQEKMKYKEQAERLKLIQGEYKYPRVLDLAEALGFSQSAMSGYLKGTVMSFELVLALYKVHKINPRWFILGEGPMILSGDDPMIDPKTIKNLALGLPSDKRKKLAIALIQAELDL